MARARPETTTDTVLGGRVRIEQPRRGFRAGVDAVLLAAAVPAVAGQTVLDLGCGVGTAALCLAARVPRLALWGVDRQPEYAAFAARNGAANACPVAVSVADVCRLSSAVRARRFDHVVTNPPYFHPDRGLPAREPGRAAARSESAGARDWIDSALRRLAPTGVLTLIQRIDRLPEVLAALDARVGAVQVLPLQSYPARAPRLFVLRAQAGRRAAFRLMPPVILHQAAPGTDAAPYTAAISDVLQNAAPLPGFEA